MDRARTLRAAVALAACAMLCSCTVTADDGPAADSTVRSPEPAISSTATNELRVAPATPPDGSTVAFAWTDQVGGVPSENVRVSGESLSITVLVACDTEDATVRIEVAGLMTGGSTCYYDPAVTRDVRGGNTATMHTAVDQDATVTVTTEPADARWSAVISTGPPR